MRTERRVHHERDEVRGREAGHAQERRRHDGVPRPQRPDHEAGERDDADDEERRTARARARAPRRARSVMPTSATATSAEPTRSRVERPAARSFSPRPATASTIVTTASGTLIRKTQRQENGLHDHAAERRAAHGGKARERRPEPDRAPGLPRPRHAQEREARRRENGAADALQRAAADQHALVRRERGQQRRDGEQDDADDERPPEPHAVADRTADEVEGRQRERVGEVDPLLAGEPEPDVVVHRGSATITTVVSRKASAEPSAVANSVSSFTRGVRRPDARVSSAHYPQPVATHPGPARPDTGLQRPLRCVADERGGHTVTIVTNDCGGDAWRSRS